MHRYTKNVYGHAKSKRAEEQNQNEWHGYAATKHGCAQYQWLNF